MLMRPVEAVGGRLRERLMSQTSVTEPMMKHKAPITTPIITALEV